MYGWIFVAPIFLLLVTWIKVVLAKNFDKTVKIAWVPLIAATLSDAYLWLSVPFHEIMGPFYSRLRYDLIFLNLAAVLIVAIVICFWESIARWWLFAASLSLALQWLFVGAINSVV
jgi:hypothetical protein